MFSPEKGLGIRDWGLANSEFGSRTALTLALSPEGEGTFPAPGPSPGTDRRLVGRGDFSGPQSPLRLRASSSAPSGKGSTGGACETASVRPRNRRDKPGGSLRAFLIPNPQSLIPPLQPPLRAGHAGDAGDRARRPCAGARAAALKMALGDVVAVAAVVQHEVQVGQGVGRHRLPEDRPTSSLSNMADLGRGELGLEDEIGPAAEVDGAGGQRSLPSAA